MRQEEIISTKDNIRLDAYISEIFNDISRTTIKKMILDGQILLNGINKKPNIFVKIGDVINITFSEEKTTDIIPQDIKLNIIYEDENIIVVNKPQGMVVHPAPGSENETLVNALMYYTKKLSTINEERMGIVHRLDKDTSGLIICAKDNETHLKLVEMFSKREIIKKYMAVCNGIFTKDTGFIDVPIGRCQSDRKKMTVTKKNSKNALTEYRVISHNNKYTLLDVTLHTGRTHQIRVHLKYINHNIVGDKTYGLKTDKLKLNGQLLHSYYLEFNHPISKNKLCLYAPIPEEFEIFLKKENLSYPNFS